MYCRMSFLFKSKLLTKFTAAKIKVLLSKRVMKKGDLLSISRATPFFPFFGTHDSLELIFSELLSIIVASHTWF